MQIGTSKEGSWKGARSEGCSARTALSTSAPTTSTWPLWDAWMSTVTLWSSLWLKSPPFCTNRVANFVFSTTIESLWESIDAVQSQCTVRHKCERGKLKREAGWFGMARCMIVRSQEFRLVPKQIVGPLIVVHVDVVRVPPTLHESVGHVTEVPTHCIEQRCGVLVIFHARVRVVLEQELDDLRMSVECHDGNSNQRTKIFGKHKEENREENDGKKRKGKNLQVPPEGCHMQGSYAVLVRLHIVLALGDGLGNLFDVLGGGFHLVCACVWEARVTERGEAGKKVNGGVCE